MGESVTADIVEAIAEEEDVDPTTLDFSLQEHIDADALGLLVEHPSSSWTIRFDVPGHQVVLSGNGTVQVNDSRSEIDA